MQLGMDAELVQPLLRSELLQYAPIYLVLRNGRVVLTKLLCDEERAHVIDSPLVHRLRLRNRRL
jgi:hypothetical protein